MGTRRDLSHAASGGATVVTALAYAAQAFVLLATLAMWPLGWRSPLYVPALMQAGLAFALLSWLAARRRAVVGLVPVLSAALTVALIFVGLAHGRATACTDEDALRRCRWHRRPTRRSSSRACTPRAASRGPA